MSVIIRGMTMPDMCSRCDFLSGLICPDGIYVCECPSTNIYERNVQRAIEEDSRHPECPLVEVPEPHGRLIDADEITAFRELERNGANVELLDEFPTIIEAEGE